MILRKANRTAALLAIVMVFTIVLSGCAKQTGNGGGVNPDSSAAVSGVWSSEGGAFKQTYVDISDDSISFFTHGLDIYTINMDFSASASSYASIWRNGEEEIYISDRGYIYYADASDEGIWFVDEYSDGDTNKEELTLISFSGEHIRIVRLETVLENGERVFGIRCNDDLLYLRVNDRIVVLSTNGEKLADFPFTDCVFNMAFGNGGEAYIVCYYKDKIDINRIDGTTLTLSCTLSTPNATIFNGDDTHHLILSDYEGLYSLDADGSLLPIVIWRDCDITMLDLRKVCAMPDGTYLCWDAGGASRLAPVDPSEIKKRTELVLAIVGGAYSTRGTVAAFNRRNSEYIVVIKDYSEGGAYDTQTALKRLNTEIISGKHPDLMLFGSLSPFIYTSKGYLMDLYQFIDSDGSLSRGDIAIADQLEIDGGLYYLANRFVIETLVGLHSEFGDRNGWTLDEYLEIEKNMPANAETLYNTTKSQFLRQISARYLRTAVNWETGKCDFNNEVFISILEASSRVKENPESEDPTLLDFTYGSLRVAQGTLVAALTWVDHVWKLAYDERMAGCRLSFIGWPTVDGSCGSDIYINEPLGICSQTSFPEGCWQFMKFMLTDVDQSSIFLPAYMPYLEAQIERATRESSPAGDPMTSQDVERLLTLLAETDNVALYDEVILGIIEEEASAFFAGDKTAQNTAAAVQSRVQLYISEQY